MLFLFFIGSQEVLFIKKEGISQAIDLLIIPLDQMARGFKKWPMINQRFKSCIFIKENIRQISLKFQTEVKCKCIREYKEG